MNQLPGGGKSRFNPLRWHSVACGLALTSLVAASAFAATPNVAIWDTGQPLTPTSGVTNRQDWTLVPPELFAFEKDPAKASSDPGYYGREYTFRGDPVLENERVLAVFSSAQGQLTIFSKTTGSDVIVQVAPLLSAGSTRVDKYDIVRNECDEAILTAQYTASGSNAARLTVVLGRDEVIEVKPGAGTRGLRIGGPVQYGIVPGFIGDDLVIGSSEVGSSESVTLPVENAFVGLLEGEKHALVMTWPSGQQQVRLRRAGGPSGRGRGFDPIEIESTGESLYLACLSAPGIWHREELKPAYLEKEIASRWQRPFPARWKTQLLEAGVKTTFGFREGKGEIWRGVPGSYAYPVWFEGNTAHYHLSKKVPPKGESIIYFLEGQDTPLGVLTPVDMIKSTLGRAASEPLLDPAGRKLRTHHRRGGEGVHRACTCGCTEAIQAVFENGREVEDKAYVAEALEDMNFFVQRHVERINEYTRFASDLLELLKKNGAGSPQLKVYCDALTEVAQQIPEEYNNQKENMKSLDHARDLTRQTLALTAAKNPDNLKAYMELLNAWRAMGGAQDYVLAQCHTITRKLFQEAGYASLPTPSSLPLAREVRNRCRQVLRNPDGYEIWAGY